MIKFNRSNIHEFQNIFLFMGKEIETNGEFLYKESSLLFGKEILAPYLIEYQKEDEKLFDFKLGIINEVVSKIKIDQKKFVNFVDIKISKNLDGEVNIFYDKKMISSASINSIQSALSDYTKFDVKVSEKLSWNPFIANLDLNKARYFQIQFSEKFIQQRSSSLSFDLSKSFSADRYVDTQVACFMLMTTISGSSTKR